MSKPLFSVTAKDCRWDYFRGSGKGGQKRNKTSSGVRCTHIASGAVGVSDETRSQHKNKEDAFLKMAQTREFKVWHKLEVSKVLGLEKQIEESVDRAMSSRNLSLEVFKDGTWEDYYSVR